MNSETAIKSSDFPNSGAKNDSYSLSSDYLIIKIIRTRDKQLNQYALNNVQFSFNTAEELRSMISAERILPSAVFIDSSFTAEELSHFDKLLRDHCVPLIVFTSKFETEAKVKAQGLGADDYLFGAINESLLYRIDTLRKLKEYDAYEREHPSKQRQENPFRMWPLKRTFDVLVACCALLALAPLLILIAIIIKLESKGPVFYISKRAGAGYKIFDFYKFRSMRTGADQELKDLAAQNQYGAEEGIFFKIKDDPRITRFGSFLRNTSLDELPQLFNVLKGDMSLVGNRPLPLYEAEKLTQDQVAWRFLAPAGLTGLWQITKRGKHDMSPQERIQLDIDYAMNNSFLKDIEIILKTFPALLQKEKV